MAAVSTAERAELFAASDVIEATRRYAARVAPKHIPLDTTEPPAETVTVFLGGKHWDIGVEGDGDGCYWPTSVLVNGMWLDIDLTFNSDVCAAFHDAMREARRRLRGGR